MHMPWPYGVYSFVVIIICFFKAPTHPLSIYAIWGCSFLSNIPFLFYYTIVDYKIIHLQYNVTLLPPSMIDNYIYIVYDNIYLSEILNCYNGTYVGNTYIPSSRNTIYFD